MNEAMCCGTQENMACKDSEISSQLSRLDEAVKFFSERLSTLLNRLEPAATPRLLAKEVGNEKEVEPRISVIAMRIMKTRKEIEAMNEKVNDATSSLEI